LFRLREPENSGFIGTCQLSGLREQAEKRKIMDKRLMDDSKFFIVNEILIDLKFDQK